LFSFARLFFLGHVVQIFRVKEKSWRRSCSLYYLLTSVFVFPLSTLVFAPEVAAQDAATKATRWDGIVIRSSPDKSTLTVRKRGGSAEMIVQYDGSTKWVSQEHGRKKVNDIDASQVKDNDRVICQGTYSKDGVLHATFISKRLSR
jgi:hypothetical protein